MKGFDLNHHYGCLVGNTPKIIYYISLKNNNNNTIYYTGEEGSLIFCNNFKDTSIFITKEEAENELTKLKDNLIISVHKDEFDLESLYIKEIKWGLKGNKR